MLQSAWGKKKSLRFEPGRCQFWFLPWFKETNAMAGADETENQDVDTNRANAPPGRRQLHSFSPASHLEELRPRSRSRAREEAEALQANMPSASRGIEETRIKEIKQLVEVELSQHVSPEALHQLKRHALDLSSKIETLQKVWVTAASQTEPGLPPCLMNHIS